MERLNSLSANLQTEKQEKEAAIARSKVQSENNLQLTKENQKLQQGHSETKASLNRMDIDLQIQRDENKKKSKQIDALQQENSKIKKSHLQEIQSMNEQKNKQTENFNQKFDDMAKQLRAELLAIEDRMRLDATAMKESNQNPAK